MKHLLSLIKSPSSSAAQADAVHFHGGAAGPYVCVNPRCTSPHLSERELRAALASRPATRVAP